MTALVSALTALAAPAPPGLTPQQALTTALTSESLLFAAFGVSYSLATTARDGGRSAFFARGWFGWVILAVLVAIAASAVSGWHATFDRDWPNDLGEYLRAYGLLAAIVSQPVFALIINLEARRA